MNSKRTNNTPLPYHQNARRPAIETGDRKQTPLPHEDIPSEANPNVGKDSDGLAGLPGAQAIADHICIEVTDASDPTGFRLRVAPTRAVWADIHAIPEHLQSEATSQDRLRNILTEGCSAMENMFPSHRTCITGLHMPVGAATQYLFKLIKCVDENGERFAVILRPEE